MVKPVASLGRQASPMSSFTETVPVEFPELFTLFCDIGSVRGERLSDGLGAWNQVESTGRHSRTQQKIGHVN